MARYKVQGPDGKVHVFEGPDGATPEEVEAFAEQTFSAKQPSQPKPEPSVAQEIAANPATRFAVGAAAPALGAVQRMGSLENPTRTKATLQSMPLLTIASALAKPGIDESLNSLREMQAAGGHTGYDFAGLAGNMLSPLSLGAGKIPIPASMLGRAGTGAAIGGAGGAMAPSESDEQARANALYGALGGGIAAPVVGAIGGAANWLSKRASETRDLFRAGDEGAANILRRYVSSPKVVGEEAMPGVIQATRNAADILPGGKPTVAEAVVGGPGASPLSAMQRIVSQSGGGQSDKFTARLADQEAAIEAAKTARGAVSKVNYGKAFDTAINAVSSKDPELAAIVSNPFFRDAMPAAVKLAQAKGITPTNNVTEFLHDVKLGLDKKLNNKGDLSLDAATHRQVQNVKSQLVEWLAKKNPDYELGRAQHQAASKLIDEFVERQAAALNPLVKTNLGGGLNITEETRQHLPNLLSRTAMTINYAMKAAGKNVEPKVDRLAADLFLNPKRFAEEMAKMPPELQLDIAKALGRTNALAFGGASAQ